MRRGQYFSLDLIFSNTPSVIAYLVRGPPLGVLGSLLSLSSSDLVSVERLSCMSSFSCFSTFSSKVEGTWPGSPAKRPAVSEKNMAAVKNHSHINSCQICKSAESSVFNLWKPPLDDWVLCWMWSRSRAGLHGCCSGWQRHRRPAATQTGRTCVERKKTSSQIPDRAMLFIERVQLMKKLK